VSKQINKLKFDVQRNYIMVIFFDIDGTLVDDKTQILPQSAVEAIHALTEKGHITVVNTGRPYSHIDPRIRALPFAGCICAGGQEIFLQGRWLKRQTVPAQWLPEILQGVRENGLQVLYEAEGGYYLDGDPAAQHPEIGVQCRMMLQNGGYVRDVDRGITEPVVKFCTFDTPGCDRMAFVEKMRPGFEYIDRRGMAEFLVKGNSKAAGLQMVLDEIGCPRAETMAFGDSANDLPMLQAVGIGICMGNGVEKAREAAAFVTKSVLEDGIAYALRHFGLI
jgi:HAD superfamily hydrolase (TIGR01484 family)